MPNTNNLIFNEEFRKDLLQSKLNYSVLIPFIEDLINYELASLDANRILNNELACLKSENKITHAEILLSLLRINSLSGI